MQERKLPFVWDLGKSLGNYSNDQWFKFGFRCNVGEANKENKWTIIINDQETTYQIETECFNYIDYATITLNGTGTVYFDDFNSTIDQYVENYFANTLKIKQPEESSDTEQTPEITAATISQYGNDNSDKDNTKGLNAGQIAGIVIGVLAYLAVVAAYVLLKKRSEKKEDSAFDLMI